jgi:oxygen-independent coproporphyrinogen-3 oxidase
LRYEIETAEALPATTIFLGGGTPNTYPPQTVAEIILLVRDRFALPIDAEVSIECNPDPSLCEGFDLYRKAGITRISFGVQSFVQAELKVLGRRHTAADIKTAVARARAAGFTNISLDIMFGMPGQTLASLDESIDALLGLDVPHVSAYGLTVEAGTPYEIWRERAPDLFDDDIKEAELYARLIERLNSAGYEQYELSNFARPGFRSQHNTQYWNNDEYFGFGLGAASYRKGVRRVNTKDFELYVEAVSNRREIPGEAEALDGDARIGEAIMLALRRKEGVNVPAFDARYGVNLGVRFADVIAGFCADGMLENDEFGFRLTHAGRFLANDICAAFLAPVPPA